MARFRNPNAFLALFFAGVLLVPATLQLGLEMARRERPRVFELFNASPTGANLHAYEKMLEETSWVAAHLRPIVQYAHFVLLHDAGEKALLGQNGWCFYKPGVDYIILRPAARAAEAATDPLPAIVAFRDALATRSIHLLLVPMPNKESIYPEQLSPRAVPFVSLMSPETRSVIDRARAGGVEVLDLFRACADVKRTEASPSAQPLYLAQDSHWSPAGVQLAAQRVADGLVQRGWIRRGATEYTTIAVPVPRIGDVIRMLQVPWLEKRTAPEQVTPRQVKDGRGQPYRDSPEAEVLVLGDSFLRIYERDEPGSAGFIAHLALALRQPVSSIVSDGGASTLVRQELSRRPSLLAHTKVVVWEFVERDIRLGTEGWQLIPLPSERP